MDTSSQQGPAPSVRPIDAFPKTRFLRAPTVPTEGHVGASTEPPEMRVPETGARCSRSTLRALPVCLDSFFTNVSHLKPSLVLMALFSVLLLLTPIGAEASRILHVEPKLLFHNGYLSTSINVTDYFHDTPEEAFFILSKSAGILWVHWNLYLLLEFPSGTSRSSTWIYHQWI